MSALTRARVARPVCTPVEPAAVERSLARFDARWRNRIRRFASGHPRLADLAIAFPALLFALATRTNNDARAVALAIAGAPLKTVANAAGVPLWLRRLPPEAFVTRLCGLPDGDMFRHRIANHLPHRARLAAHWLSMVRAAAEYCDEAFAIWVAREITRGSKIHKPENLRLVALYAWYSRRSEASGHKLLSKPWLESMTYKNAVEEAERWHEAMRLNFLLSGKRIDPWFKPGMVMGLDFVPLLTSDAIAEEARIMDNCLRSYGLHVADGRVRLWSIRQGNEHIATLSVGFQRSAPALTAIPQIFELLGPKNDTASREIWLTAVQWIENQDFSNLDQRSLRVKNITPERAGWIAMWRPYWIAKRHIPDWLPLAPCPAAFQRLLMT